MYKKYKKNILARMEKNAMGKATLFVRNISFECNQQTLETFLKEKIKNGLITCFLVDGAGKSGDKTKEDSDKNSNSHRGFAFLHFISRESAKEALFTLQNSNFMGRKLRVDFAIKKTTDLDEKNSMIKRKKQVFRVFVPYTESLGKEKMEKKIRQILLGTPLKIKYHSQFLVLELQSKSDASTTVEKLGKGSINAKLQETRFRLIVRNMPFNIKQEDFDSFFASYSPLEAHLPASNKGFAFLEFESKEKCDAVMKEANGKKFMKRTIAIDYAVSKKEYSNDKVDDKENAIKGNEAEELENASDSESENDSDSDDSDIDSNNNSDINSNIDSDINSDIDSEEDLDEEKSFNALENDSAETTVDTLEDTSHAKKVRMFDAHENCTVFIRDLPDSAQKEEIKSALSSFGKIKFVKLVTDKKTGEFKHSCFVKFENSEDARKVVDECKKAFITDNTEKKTSILVNEGEGKRENA
jgi:nucleolar protein 4